MLITKCVELDMGHRVPNHKSKCRNLHGHRYKVEVGVDDKLITNEGSSDEGMVIDFSDLKQIMIDEIDSRYDHAFMMYESDTFAHLFQTLKDDDEQRIFFVPFIPTAENIAKYFYSLIKDRLALKGISIHHVKVWETPTSTAVYTKYDESEEQKTPKDLY